MAGWHNLSQEEANRRADLITVGSYDVDLDLSGAGRAAATFTGVTTVRFDCTRPGADTFIELAAESVTRALLNGDELDLTGWSAQSGLALPGLRAHNELVVTAEFEYTSQARGLHRTIDPVTAEVFLYTQFEPADAQRVYACFDQPDLKAEFTWHARVPQQWRAISNMPSSTVDDHGDGTRTVHFAPTPRISTYITALCAGTFVEVRRTLNGVDIGLFCRPELAKDMDADEMFDILDRGMRWFGEQFALAYPLTKYDQVAVAEYSGAMENIGCVVFAETAMIFRSKPTEQQRGLRATVMLHELAHMWFGDMVTMRWWDDIWLNEAFATWAANWCRERVYPVGDAWATFAVTTKTMALQADRLSSSHPVYQPTADVATIETNFDAITYRKGASVLRQFTALVGEKQFVAGLQGYFARNLWANATAADLLAALSTADGNDIAEVARDWLETTGATTLRAEATIDADRRYQRVVLCQEPAQGQSGRRTHQLDLGLFDRDGTRLLARAAIPVRLAGARQEVPELIGAPAADLVLPNVTDLTYARVRLDDRSLATVREAISGLDQPLARAVCWTAAGDMVADAEFAGRDFVAMVCDNLPAELDPTLVDAVLSTAGRVLDLSTDPAWEPRGRARLAEVCRSAARAAQAGSPMQLTWVHAAATATRTPRDVAEIRSWLDGKDLPAGLVVDRDLRWILLRALVAAGAAGPEDIDRELDRDRSLSGMRQSVRARAQVATEAGKQRAWQDAVLADGTASETRMAGLLGFGHPAHTALTAAYVPQYFDALDDLWRRLGPEPAVRIASTGFPLTQVQPGTVQAAQQWLDRDGHQLALRRIVSDGRDLLCRALAARAFDAATPD